MFEQELAYFKANQEYFVRQYPSKVLAIIGEEVIGIFDNYLLAYSEMSKTYSPGTFMLQLAIPGESAYTVTIRSLAYA